MVSMSEILDGVADKMATEPPMSKVLNPKSVAWTLEKHGFRRDIAGDGDFDRLVKAICRSTEANKGILITGGNGCGKSLAMKVIHDCTPTRSKEWIDCNDANQIGSLAYSLLDDMNIYLDDFGGERMLYGDVDLVGAFITQWHAHHEPRRTMHITTNLTGAEIQQRCGGRVYDRLSDLVVICPFEGGSKRVAEVIR